MKLFNNKIQKVALINPNYITKSITDRFTIPALGLESIAASISDLVEVKIIDAKAKNLNIKQIMEKINKFKPNIVGISCCFTIGINFALKIAKKSKEFGYITILGGWHPSFAYSEVLKHSFIDIVVKGEGELTFRDLIKNKDLEVIEGISYKNKGIIIDNPERPLIQDLNKLPYPSRNLRDDKVYYQIFQMPIDVIETSRGCPFKCTFCNIHLFYRGTYRTKNPRRVIDELKIIANQIKRKNVLIVDDNFTVNMKRVEVICDLIIKEGLKLDLICQSRVDVIKKNPDVIKKMSKAGFWLIFLGIESFSQKNLNNIQKKVSLRDIIDAIKILHDNDMLIIGSLLIGSSLDEKEEDIELMLKFVKKLRIDFPIFSLMTPLPGTKFRETIIENNFLLSYNWSEYNFTTAVNQLKELSKEKLEQMLARGYYEGYFNRGWKDTLIRLYKKKGIKYLLNIKKSYFTLKDFLGFFKSIRKMKKDSFSDPPKINFN